MRVLWVMVAVLGLVACGQEPDNSGFIDPEDYEASKAAGEDNDHDHDGDGLPDHDAEDHDHDQDDHDEYSDDRDYNRDREADLEAR